MLSRTVNAQRFCPTFKLICEPANNFMDAGRRNKNPRTETKDFVIHGNIHICASTVGPVFHKGGQMTPVWTIGGITEEEP